VAKLADIASRARDLFNQDYPDRNEFFDEGDFRFHLASIYAKKLNALFQIIRSQNKVESGFSNVEISPQWLYSQNVKKTDIKLDEERQQWYVDASFNIFSFDFDSFGNGLNGIRPYGTKCNLKKISTQELRFHDIIPTTPDVYYFLEGKRRINFLTNPKSDLTLYYVPEVNAEDDNCTLSDALVPDMIMETLQLMFGAKNGNVVKEANDGNKNDTILQQVNPVLNKVQSQ